jgi:hypothetical protein
MSDDMRQLTIRLNGDTLQDLERVVEVMQKDGPVGVVYTRTDALRNVIMRGISSYTGNLPAPEPPPPAAKPQAAPVKKRKR